MSGTLYEYYRHQEVLPTYGRFQSRDDLAAHERQRRRLFTDKLFLPPRLFESARLLEFGPDAGENSLVFALWGANCTLSEPNLKAHSVIRDYFQRFGLVDRLASLESADVTSFSQPGAEAARFDIIDAEGFIYTVKPESLWTDKFARLVRKDGFVILFYCEAYGGFIELMLKAVQARMRQLSGLSAVESARQLFRAKWDSIPHKRKMESWIMDVLENPFVRLRYFLEPRSLCDLMARADFSLYSSWPPYKDGLDVHWFKKIRTLEEQLCLQKAFIAQNRLSHLFGRKHFLLQAGEDLEKMLWNLLTLMDGLIDRFDADAAKQCADYLSELVLVLKSNDVVSDTQDMEATIQTIKCFQRLLDLMFNGSAADLVSFCNQNEAFIRAWGMPSHFAVFRKEEVV
jgi:hypothetical protein